MVWQVYARPREDPEAVDGFSACLDHGDMSTERRNAPERGVAINSARDPQKPGEGTQTPPRDPYPPGTSAEETPVPTDPFAATHEPGSPAGPEDAGRGKGEEGAL
jgi:hypothetical protein